MTSETQTQDPERPRVTLKNLPALPHTASILPTAFMSRNYIHKINKIDCAKVDYVKKNLLVQDVKVTPGHIGSTKVKKGLIVTTCFAWHHRVMYNYH